MKNLLVFFVKGLFLGIGFFVSVALLYAAWQSGNPGVTDVNLFVTGSGSALTADKWNALVDKVENVDTKADTALASAGGSNIPSGTVAAFNLTVCPDGWVEADGGTSGELPDLRGAFIRGMNGDENGRENTARELRDYKADTFASHLHSVNPPSTTTSENGLHSHTMFRVLQGGSTNRRAPAVSKMTQQRPVDSAGAHTHTLDIAKFDSGSTGSTETAPKNVILLYCIKQ